MILTLMICVDASPNVVSINVAADVVPFSIGTIAVLGSLFSLLLLVERMVLTASCSRVQLSPTYHDHSQFNDSTHAVGEQHSER
jgi:hypothetical protein